MTQLKTFYMYIRKPTKTPLTRVVVVHLAYCLQPIHFYLRFLLFIFFQNTGIQLTSDVELAGAPALSKLFKPAKPQEDTQSSLPFETHNNQDTFVEPTPT